jgi:hypothetical protein
VQSVDLVIGCRRILLPCHPINAGRSLLFVATGSMMMVRYADDTIVGFRQRYDTIAIAVCIAA